MQIEQMKERLDMYEKALKSMRIRFNRLQKRKVKRRSEDDCIIHLSFSGLNKAFSLKGLPKDVL